MLLSEIQLLEGVWIYTKKQAGMTALIPRVDGYKVSTS